LLLELEVVVVVVVLLVVVLLDFVVVRTVVVLGAVVLVVLIVVLVVELVLSSFPFLRATTTGATVETVTGSVIGASVYRRMALTFVLSTVSG
jgi:hypothetical protein